MPCLPSDRSPPLTPNSDCYTMVIGIRGTIRKCPTINPYSQTELLPNSWFINKAWQTTRQRRSPESTILLIEF